MLLDPRFVLDRLPRTEPGAHKYTRGVVGLSTGSGRYPGAAVLGVAAALSTGVGMVRYRGPERAANLILAARPEAVCEPRHEPVARAQCWVLGSGMEDSDETRAEAERILDAARDSGARLVVDAGALLSAAPLSLGKQLGGSAVLTPHAGELEQLLGRLGSGKREQPARAEIEAAPKDWAVRAADLTGCTVLLKGPTTWVAAPGAKPLGVRAGHPWLATAGSGDVLAGVIGALAATSPEPLNELAACAAWIHGRAGVLAARQGPYGASELPAAIRAVIADLLAGRAG